MDIGSLDPRDPNFFEEGKILRLDPDTYRRIMEIIGETKPVVFCMCCGCAIIEKERCICHNSRWN